MILDRKDLSKFVFQVFNNSGIKYALMRDIEKSLYSSAAKDYDVAIQEKDLLKILECFRKTKECNILYINQRSFCTSIGFIVKIDGSYACFSVDLIFNFSIYGISFASTKELLDETVISYIDGVEIQILNQRANRFVSILPAIYHNYVEQPINEADSKIIAEFCNDNFSFIKRNNLIIGVKLVKRQLFMELRALVSHCLMELRIYYSRDTITTIAFLGPDGAGKTAIISKVAQEFSKAFVSYETLHLKPKLFFKKRYEKRGVVTQPHALEPRPTIIGLLKILVWNFELAVYYYFTKRHNQTLAIFDRYMLDVLVDPQRYRLRDNFLIKKFTRTFLPNLTIIVGTEPELATKRKGEITIGLARELTQAYTGLDKELMDRSVMVMNNSTLNMAIKKTYDKLHRVNFQ